MSGLLNPLTVGRPSILTLFVNHIISVKSNDGEWVDRDTHSPQHSGQRGTIFDQRQLTGFLSSLFREMTDIDIPE